MIDSGEYRWLQIEPVDAWFFRDGRPFNRGESQDDLECLFPPAPVTVVGALRAALARERGWSGSGSWTDHSHELRDILGDGFEDLGRLRFLGPFLLQNGELLWPMPRHVVGHMAEETDEEGRTRTVFVPKRLLRPTTDPVICDVGETRLPELSAGGQTVSAQSAEKPPKPADGVFLTTAGMSKVLAGHLPDKTECRLSEDLFTEELRVGISREVETRTTGRAALYNPRYLRLKPGVSLIEGVAGLPDQWQLPTLMPLGGESRMATVTLLERPPTFPQLATGSLVTLISATPACFAEPWWGAWPGDGVSRLSGELAGTVVTVAVDRPQRIGGWDSLAGSPLPLRPFVPAGTVWWFESEGMPPNHMIQIGQRHNYGYGICLIGSAESHGAP